MTFTVAWFRDAAERAVSTFAQSFLSVIGGDALNVWHFGWKTAAGVAVGGAVLSLLKSLAARRVGDPESASLVR
jgi:hypothetical protein